MLLWYARSTSGSFTEANKMPTPSTYKIDWEDLDNKTYRSIATGDMIDTVISKKWSKLQFSYKHLTQEEVNKILTAINVNPIYVKAINPLFSSGYIEAQFRCSKASCEMLEDHCYSLSFNLVQKKKVTGQ
jgi:hypothetical protein